MGYSLSGERTSLTNESERPSRSGPSKLSLHKKLRKLDRNLAFYDSQRASLEPYIDVAILYPELYKLDQQRKQVRLQLKEYRG